MKSTEKPIDFDFIGSQEPITKEDKELISEYFKAKKFLNSRPSKPRTKKLRKTKKTII